jgi:hypothetical protein
VSELTRGSWSGAAELEVDLAQPWRELGMIDEPLTVFADGA